MVYSHFSFPLCCRLLSESWLQLRLQKMRICPVVSFTSWPEYSSKCVWMVLSTFNSNCHSLQSCADPRLWTEKHVAEWLTWTVNEFSLKNVDFDKFGINGASLCAMGKERFLDLAPDFVGDILWEHLEMLQKGNGVRWLSSDYQMSLRDLKVSVLWCESNKKALTTQADITAYSSLGLLVFALVTGAKQEDTI